ncbi:sce7726 family protein [Halorhodospira sp. 9622]|uniref:sce7726 family protein n=1 Tax=Halorhodospira sp. 9622 TaxID=2899136 RepID=UPI001EE9173E|nr:sce7726 family protein [Halorhodospira sp. 9622]MCG5538982.1 sce7726 family protein [Halorhodospira sp. 9622]
MRELEVRQAVRDKLRGLYQGDPRTRVVEEMGVWSGSVRVDVAVINGELSAFELKSERDTLERLPKQAELYNQVFDRVTLVSASRHLSKALSCIPEWWGVLAAEMQDGHVRLYEERGSGINPGIDSIQVARLLWRDEALDILVRHGIERGVKSKRAELIYSRMAESLTLETICHEVRESLKKRSGWLRNCVSD